jgi:VWFA-related protein
VVLPVQVTDKRGAFIDDLSQEHFSVFDNGRPQDVAFFSNEDVPVSIGLVIDNSGSMRPKLPEVAAAALALARSSNPHDELFTIPFNDTVLDLGRPASFASEGRNLQAELLSLVPQGRTALYDALIVGLQRVALGRNPRRALIVISDGGDNASRATLEDVLTRARRSNVVIFTVGLFDDGDFDRNPSVLKSLAQSTGGERFLPSSPKMLTAACGRIAHQLRNGYTLGYLPPDRDGLFHRIRVEVVPSAGEKLIVRTRPGYFAAGSADGPR